MINKLPEVFQILAAGAALISFFAGGMFKNHIWGFAIAIVILMLLGLKDADRKIKEHAIKHRLISWALFGTAAVIAAQKYYSLGVKPGMLVMIWFIISFGLSAIGSVIYLSMEAKND